MQLAISVLSKPGGREPNEDAFGFWTNEGTLFCVVSDGAGGHGGGDVASKVAVRAALAQFQQAPACTGEAVEAAVRSANDAVVAKQHMGDSRVAAMRATIAVLALDAAHHVAAWAHLGDTRVYCFRERAVMARTKDHSVVQRMVDAGYLAEEALRASDHRSRLFAALGESPAIDKVHDAAGFDVHPGDAFLLCTDGFWEHLDERGMEAALANACSPETWLRTMEDVVVRTGGERQDNYSAVAVWCTKPGHTGELCEEKGSTADVPMPQRVTT